MSASFTAWLLALDPDKRRATSSPASWIGIFLSGTVVMAIAGLVPVSRDYFGLRFWPAFCMFVPPIVVGAVGGDLEAKGRLGLRAYGTTLFVNSVLFQLYMGSLVAFSRAPGAALMGAFPVLLACYHGHLLHSSPRHPYGTVATTLALAGNLALNHDREHLVLMALIAPASILGSLVLGQFSVASRRERDERIALRQAVDAQILSDRTREVERVAGSVLRLRAHNHDAGNTLSSTLINAQLLVAALEKHQLEDGDRAEALALTRDLWEGLKVMKALLETAREVGIEEQLSFETVDLERVLRRVVAQINARYTQSTFSIHFEGGLSACRVSVSGGETSLDRMLGNLVLNAAQGNGAETASHVDVAVSSGKAPGQVCILVGDDGPGFSQAQLDAQLSGFTTTKVGGTGLGLYTTDRLARASRGSIARANRGTGGAIVALDLNLARTAAAEDAGPAYVPRGPNGERRAASPASARS